MSSLESFVLGVLVTIIVALFAPFTTGPIQRWWGARNKKQGLRVIRILENEYAVVEDYHNDAQKMLRFIGARILLLTTLWIGQSCLDVVFGFIVNGFSVARLTLNYYVFPLNTDAVSNWVNATASLVDGIILAVLFRIGIRSYRTVRNVINFDQYTIKIKNEIATIREKNKLPEEPT